MIQLSDDGDDASDDDDSQCDDDASDDDDSQYDGCWQVGQEVIRAMWASSEKSHRASWSLLTSFTFSSPLSGMTCLDL